MIQHTPLQEPRHAPNPACRDPGAPRPTGSPIIYRRSITGTALLSALILTLVTACGSGGGQAGGSETGGGSGAPSSAPSVAPSSQVPATPPDVPTGNLSCPSQFPSAVTVTQAVQDLISLCATQDGTQWDIINISED